MIVTNDMRLNCRDVFNITLMADNWEAVTLMPDPLLKLDLVRLEDYCRARQIDYYLVKEEAGQVHYHGIMGFPFDKIRKNFQTWFNHQYGKYYQGTKADVNKWYNYVHKGPDRPDYSALTRLNPTVRCIL